MRRPRRLSIALLTYSTKPRGSVVHTLSLAEALAQAGQRVTVWSLGRGGDDAFFRPVDPRVELRIVPFPDVAGEAVGSRIVRSIQVMGKAFDPAGYDVVHAQDCISANAAGRCMRTVHHLDHFTTPELAACHQRAIVEPHAHICVSAAVAGELLNGWGITATVIPNGVDAQRFSHATGPAGAAARATWRSRLGRYVLTVGGIEPRKGSLELLEAYARLYAELPDVRLVIAGGETLFDYRDYRAGWELRATQLGIEPVVLGPVDHQGRLRAGRDGSAGRRSAAGYVESASAARDLHRHRPVRRRLGGVGDAAARCADHTGRGCAGSRPLARRPPHLVSRSTTPPRPLSASWLIPAWRFWSALSGL
jgi:glycosyltransferase-like protein